MTVVAGLDAAAATRLGRLLGAVLSGRSPEGIDATLEIGGRLVELRDLPPFPADIPVVLSWDDVEAYERERFGAAASAHERKLAELDARRAELTTQIEALEEAIGDLGRRGEQLDEELGEVRAWLAAQHARRRVADAVRAVHGAERIPAPVPEQAATLADRWEQFVALRSAARDQGGGAVSAEQAAARVEQARARLAEIDAGSEGVSAEAADHIQALHAQVESLEQELERAKRNRRRQVEQELEGACAREFEALARYGFPSRAAFLVALAQGTSATDLDTRREVVHELEEAMAVDHACHAFATVLGTRSIEELETELRAEAARVLGHLPPPDVAAALRQMRVEPVELLDARAELRHRVVETALDAPGDDHELLRVAHTWVEQNPTASRDDVSDGEVRLVALEAESAALAERISSRRLKLASARRELDVLAEELARHRAEPPTPQSTSERESSVEVVDSLVAAARPPQSRVPLVLSGLFRDLSPQELTELLERLRRHSEHAQLIVVTDLDAVLRWAQSGADGVAVWTPDDARRVEAERQQAEQERRAREASAARARQEAEERDAQLAEATAREQSQRPTEAPAEARGEAGTASDTPTRSASPAARDARAPVDARADAVSPGPTSDRVRTRDEQTAAPPPRPTPSKPAADVPATGGRTRSRRGRRRAEEIAELQARAEQRRREKRERLERFGAPPDPAAEPAPRQRPETLPAAESHEAPWARFEREIERRRRERGETKEPETPAAVHLCRRHRQLRADVACDRCGEHYCEQCLLPVKSEILCIDCALVASGARTRRRR